MFKFRKSILFIGILIVAAASSLITVAALFATGSIVADPIELVYTVEDISKTYDGTPLYANGYRLESGELKQGHSVYVEYTGSQTNVGVGESGMTVRVRDNDNHDVTAEYTIAVNPGKLTVEKCAVKLKIDNIKRVYGDEDIVVTEDNCTFVEGRFGVGHTLQSFSLKMTGTGIFNNDEIIPHVFDANSLEVTDNYDIDLDVGTIEVVRRPIIIKPKDVSVVFDNLPHTATEYEIVTSDDTYTLVPGHKVEFKINDNDPEKTSLTNVGNIDTEFSEIVIKDKDNNDVTANYDIIKNVGKLTVTQRPISVTAKSKSWIYDGVAHRMTSEDGVFSVDGLPANDEVVSVEYSPEEITNIGEIASNIITVIFGSSADNYKITYYQGTMTVTKRPLTVTTPNMTFEYDGIEHEGVNMQGSSAEQLYFSKDPGLVQGHEVTLVDVTALTDVGTLSNTVDVDIVDADGKTVKENYQISYIYGTLAVTPRNLIVTTRNLSKIFDGKIEYGVRKDENGLFNPAANGDLTVTGTIADGQALYISGGATIYGVGTKTNSFKTLKIYKFADGNYDMTASGDVTKNYAITEKFGTLTVDPATVTLYTDDVVKTYDGAVTYGTTADAEGVFSNITAHGLPVDGNQNLFRIFVPKTIGADNNIPYLKGVGTLANRFQYFIYRIKPVTAEELADGDDSYVYDDITLDQTANFTRNTGTTGTITVKPRPMTLTIASSEKVYDGKPLLGGSELTVNNIVAAIGGDNYIFDKVNSENSTVSITDVGTVKNTVKYSIVRSYYESESEDFFEDCLGRTATYASCYEICEDFGDLTVTKRKIKVWSDGYIGFYDGQRHGDAILHSARMDVSDDASADEKFGFVDKVTVDASKALTVIDVSTPISHVLSYTVTRTDYNIEGESSTVDTAGNYEVVTEWGTLQILPIYINIVTENKSAVYGETYKVYVDENGDETDLEHAKDTKYVLKPLSGAGQITPNTDKMLDALKEVKPDVSALDGDVQSKAQAIIDKEEKITENLPSIIFVGEKENSAPVLFKRDEATVTSKNFVVVDETTRYGTLTITPRPLNVTVKTNNKPYDGTPLSAVRDTSVANGTLALGDKEYDVDAASLIDVGSKTGAYKFKIHRDIDGTYVDTTDCYEITEKFGGLYVTKRPVTVKSAAVNVFYDGCDHTPDVKNMKSGDEVFDRELKGVTASKQYVDVCTNEALSIEFDLSRKNDDEMQIPTIDNYEITRELGTITINKRTLTVHTPSFTREYNGAPLVCSSLVSDAGKELYMIKELHDDTITNAAEKVKKPTVTDPYALAYLNGGGDKQVHKDFRLVPTSVFPSVTNVEDNRKTNYIRFHVEYTLDGVNYIPASVNNIEVSCDMNSWIEVTPLIIPVETDSFDLAFSNRPMSWAGVDHIVIDNVYKSKLQNLGLEIAYDSTVAAATVMYAGEIKENKFGITLVDYGSTDGSFSNKMSNFDIQPEYGQIRAIRRDVTLNTFDVNAKYDGTEHTYLESADEKKYSLMPDSGSLEQLNVNAVVKDCAKRIFAGTTNNTIEFKFISTNPDNEDRDLTDNFNIINGSIGKIIVDQREINVKSQNLGKIYDGQELRNAENQLPAVQWKDDPSQAGLVGDDVIETVVGNAYIINAGTESNRITVAITNQSSYKITYVPGTLKIDPKPITVTTASGEYIYDGKPHSDPTYTSDGIVGNDRLTLEGAVFSITNVAENKEKNNVCRFTHPNYTITPVYGTLKILPKTIEITTGSYREYYDGRPHKVESFTVSGVSDTSEFTIPEGTAFPTVTNVADGVVSNVFAVNVNSNYTAKYNYGTLEVLSLNVTATSATVNRVYNGEPVSAAEYKQITYSHELLSAAVQSCNFTAANVTKDVKSGVENTFNLTYKPNMEQNFNVTKVYGTITITKKEVTVTFNDVTRVYSGENYYNSGNVKAGEFIIVSGIVSGDNYSVNTATDWFALSTTNSWTNVGNYAVTFTLKSAKWNNYSVSMASNSAKMIVQKYPLKFTTGSAMFIYDGNPHSCADRQIGALPAGHNPVYGALPTITNVGMIENRYSLKITNGSGHDVTSNFDIDYQAGHVTVNQATLTITSKDVTMTYNGRAISTALNPATDFIFDNDELKGRFTVTPAIDDFTNVGTGVYKFTVTPKDGSSMSNYAITVNRGKLEIIPSTLTFTAPNISATYTGGNFFPTDVSKITVFGSAPTTAYTVAYRAVNATNVGTYAIEFDVTFNDPLVEKNYDVVRNYGSVIITPAALNVLVRDYGFVFDGQDHYLDPNDRDVVGRAIYEISGTGGLTVSSELFTLSGTATVKGGVIDKGTYYYKAEIRSGLTDAQNALLNNFNISYNRGVVQISQYAVTASTKSAVKEFDGKPLIERSKDVEIKDDLKITYIYKDSATITNVGSVDNAFDVKVELKLADGSYVDITKQTAVTYVVGTLTVIKANIKVSSVPVTVEYSAKAYTADFQVSFKDTSGVVKEVKADFNPIADTISIGVTPIEFAVTDILDADKKSVYGNFNIEYDPGNFEVTRRKLTYRTPSVAYLYDGTMHENRDMGTFEGLLPNTTYSISGLPGEEYYPNVTNVGDVVENARVISLNYFGTDVKDCYDITYDFGKLTVLKREITVTTGTVSAPYSGVEIYNKTATAKNLPDGMKVYINDSDPTVTVKDVDSVTNAYSVWVSDGKVSDSMPLGNDVTANFNISYVYGTVTVTPAPLTVTTGSYTWYFDGQAHSATEDADFETNNHIVGVVDGEEIGLKGAFPEINTVGTKSNAIEIEAKNANTKLSNYDIRYNFGTLIMLAGQYQFQSKSFAVDYTGDAVITSENIADYVTCNLNGSEYDGAFTVRLITPDGANYVDAGSRAIFFEVVTIDGIAVNSKLHNVSYSYGTLTINPVTVEIRLDNFTVEYNGATNNLYEYGITENAAILNGDDEFPAGMGKSDFSFTATYIGGAGTVAYSVKYNDDNGDAANYNFKIGTGLIIVNKKLATVTLATHNKEYRKEGYTLIPSTADGAAGQLAAFEKFEGFIAADGVDATKFGCPDMVMTTAGSYSFTVTVKDAAVLRNYDVNIVSGYVNINAATIGVTATVDKVTYSGAEISLALDPSKNTDPASAVVNLTFDDATCGLTWEDFVIVGASTFKNAGRYSFSLQFKNPLNNNNYVLKLSGCSFEIERLAANVTYNGATTSVYNGGYFMFDSSKFAVAGHADWTVNATMTQSHLTYDAALAACTVKKGGEDITSNLELSCDVYIERTKASVTISLTDLMATSFNKAFDTYNGKQANKYIVSSSSLVTLKSGINTLVVDGVDMIDSTQCSYTVTALNAGNVKNLFDFGGVSADEIDTYFDITIENTGVINII